LWRGRRVQSEGWCSKTLGGRGAALGSSLALGACWRTEVPRCHISAIQPAAFLSLPSLPSLLDSLARPGEAAVAAPAAAANAAPPLPRPTPPPPPSHAGCARHKPRRRISYSIAATLRSTSASAATPRASPAAPPAAPFAPPPALAAWRMAVSCSSRCCSSTCRPSITRGDRPEHGRDCGLGLHWGCSSDHIQGAAAWATRGCSLGGTGLERCCGSACASSSA